jgi:hypothetical protein
VQREQTEAVMGNKLPTVCIKSSERFPGSNTESGEVLSDNDLLAAIAEGDRHAFTVLMRKHSKLSAEVRHRLAKLTKVFFFNLTTEAKAFGLVDVYKDNRQKS